jgi:hypothetical protein
VTVGVRVAVRIGVGVERAVLGAGEPVNSAIRLAARLGVGSAVPSQSVEGEASV